MSADTQSLTALRGTITRLRQELANLEHELSLLESSSLPSDGNHNTPEAVPASSFDLLSLPDDESVVFAHVSRSGRASVFEVAEALNQNHTQTMVVLQSLTRRGLLSEDHHNGQPCYELPVIRRQARELPLDLWDLLENRLG